ncbi:MAG TPA: 2-amino-4-hydroxy-6-hydroxymethyldihydropteridine diphosphokinase [Candidatus Deferrimicrobium sp.]|nr:2-amino-4-hydroxy-6-hydroxymethyldihydropteridine diphosphokinase [Candidatus Deferrimicrobium sp.]
MKSDPVKAYIGLGSNMGNREENLIAAMTALQLDGDIVVKRTSSLYLTEPVGYLEQDSFINAVAEITTNLQAYELLSVLQKVEEKLLRERIIHWGPRTIDLDILIYGEENIVTSTLTVPHPRAIERAFVLRPLAELDPQLAIGGVPVSQWLEGVSEQKISLFKSIWFDKLKLRAVSI